MLLEQLLGLLPHGPRRLILLDLRNDLFTQPGFFSSVHVLWQREQPRLGDTSRGSFSFVGTSANANDVNGVV